MADSLLNEDLDQSEKDSLMNKWKDKTKEEILEAKINSDLFIKSQNARFDDLKKDYLALREQHQTSAELKSLIDRLEKERGTQKSDDTHVTPVETPPPAIKPEDIESLVNKKLTEAETSRKQKDNFNYVEGKLKEQWGEHYSSVYKQRLDTLGLSKEFADELAKNHPQVFMKTFELGDARQPSSLAPPKTQQRAISFSPKTPVRDWNYYQEMKKTNPKMYLDPKIAIQMHNDAIELGDAFGMPFE